MIWRRLIRMVTSEPTPAEIAAEATRAREVAIQTAKETAAKAWEAEQAAEWAAMLAAGHAEAARRAEIARRAGAYFPEDEGRGHGFALEPLWTDGGWRSRRWRWRS